jgi:uncharacterized membrane protein
MPGVAPALHPDPEFCVVVRRNNSLPRRQRWMVFAVLAGVSLVLASAFAVAGAWPVLPYSVLEITLLACAFRYVERRAEDWERVTIAGDRVIVERSAAGRRQRREFNRPWLRVECGDGGMHELTLRYAGEAWELGEALPAEERQALGAEVRRMLSRN